MARVICEDCVASGCGVWESFMGAGKGGPCECECHKVKAELIIDDPEE